MESSTAPKPAEFAAGAKTLTECFRHTAREHADRTAVRTKGDAV